SRCEGQGGNSRLRLMRRLILTTPPAGRLRDSASRTRVRSAFPATNRSTSAWSVDPPSEPAPVGWDLCPRLSIGAVTARFVAPGSWVQRPGAGTDPQRWQGRRALPYWCPPGTPLG